MRVLQGGMLSTESWTLHSEAILVSGSHVWCAILSLPAFRDRAPVKTDAGRDRR
jgi:hypothetical protein